MRNEGREVSRVHLTGMIRDGGGEIESSDYGDAAIDDGCVGPGKFAIAAALRSEINNDRTACHATHHLSGHKYGCLLTGNHRGRDDDVAFGNHFRENLALTPIK